tara:strand:- start:536 stop:865 length:330 start_codon:yes stop_codon:yes gene_type:complete
MELNKEIAVWLVDTFKKTAYGRGFKGNVYQDYLEAERIFYGRDAKQPRGCSCEYPALTRIVNSFYDQYESQIMELYEEKNTKKLSQTKTTNSKSGGKKLSIRKSKGKDS